MKAESLFPWHFCTKRVGQRKTQVSFLCGTKYDIKWLNKKNLIKYVNTNMKYGGPLYQCHC